MRITETTQYWALEGKSEAVLATRIEVSRARIRIGLEPGVIRVRVGEGDGPDVTWAATFASEEDHATDVKMRVTSSDFSALRDRMMGITARFDRLLEREVSEATDIESR